MTEQKRIAIVLPNLGGGGVERVRLLLARQFLDRGMAVDLVLVRSWGALLDEVPAGCRVVDLDAPRLRSVPPRLRAYLERERPDAVLAAMWPLSVITALTMVLARTPARLIVSEHNDLRHNPAISTTQRLLLRLLGRWLYAPAKRVIAVSEGVRDSLREVAGLRPESIAVIANPVRQSNGQTVDAADADLLAWWNRADVKLLAVGSLKPQKDYRTLVSALGTMRISRDVRLLILGDGPERRTLEAIVDGNGLHEAVRLPGFRANPYPFMRACDVFVLASRWEGLGNVLVEALHCGCRIVATDCQSGPAEILLGGRLGRLVPVGDPEAMAKAITSAAGTPHDPRPGIAHASRFSPAAAADAYLELLFPEDG